MSGPAFADRASKPDDAGLARLLGPTKALWDALLERLDAEYPDLAPEWNYYGAKYGWQVKVMGQKRAALYLIPRDGHFTAALALRDATILELRSRDVPPRIIREIENAKPGPEGRPARVEVVGRKDVEVVLQLVAAKLSC